ncbi:hypothetical protein DEO72_LG7g2174 [Vigna unguiculata]|uniref:Uncharacterized protein n=1 Tax=Vigna unguiculata TaxID=3917 RepID=A0A4D6MHG6_VIGUN|nr:hypothetical protein DEO72_LG7g2174 [Vigna unguiculata]
MCPFNLLFGSLLINDHGDSLFGHSWALSDIKVALSVSDYYSAGTTVGCAVKVGGAGTTVGCGMEVGGVSTMVGSSVSTIIGCGDGMDVDGVVTPARCGVGTLASDGA